MDTTKITIEQIKERIKNIIDPATGKTLEECKGIKHVGIDREKNLVVLIIVIGKCGGMEEKAIQRALAKIVKLELGFTGIKITFEEKRIIESIVKTNVKFILVQSGKGGVGKSTISANIAYALKRLGKKVGIIDADIYGSSIPQILEMEHCYPKADENGKIVPLNAFGMEVISTEFFAEEGKPVIWRGAMLNSMISNFFYEVVWDKNTDFIIIDCPPGTGDIALDLKQIIPNAKSIIVTSPHKSASHVATKAGYTALQLGQNIIGVIENMSYFVNPVNNQKEYIFGQGGGEVVAEKLNSEVLCKLPITQPKHHLSLFESDEESGQIFDNLAILLTILP